MHKKKTGNEQSDESTAEGHPNIAFQRSCSLNNLCIVNGPDTLSAARMKREEALTIVKNLPSAPVLLLRPGDALSPLLLRALGRLRLGPFPWLGAALIRSAPRLRSTGGECGASLSLLSERVSVTRIAENALN